MIAYAAAQRTQEIGIRLALGAGRRAIVTLVLKEALWLQCAGVAIGLLLAALAAKSARTMVYGIDAADPATLLSAAALLGGIAILASSVPAVRASRLNVTSALRCD